MEIVLATRNKKKVEEMRRITSGMDISLFTTDDFPGCPDVLEDGATFDENAVKKAVTVSRYTGRAALADDSGLEVYALNGAPGVLSARYAGEDADDRKNVQKLLEELGGADRRGARFVCSIAFAMPGEDVAIFRGYAEGRIGREPKGPYGFGYDPVFYPDGYEKTFAEMSDGEKDSLSHRGSALREFLGFLKQKTKRDDDGLRRDRQFGASR